ncbi:hypothetical protein [Streptomyces orinoci]|uniref:Uncharacterized protein n=1 Tax=Streptomyces orinoci TaxID=67339 RepID=A0ABV3K0Y9_STRON|nr:hypothetical protein [Streptomyces orinoci]
MVAQAARRGGRAGNRSTTPSPCPPVGFSARGRLWHIAVEPDSPTVSLPERDRLAEVTVPEFTRFLAELAGGGFPVTACEPFVPGDTWLRVEHSGVLIQGSPDDGLTALHHSVREIAERDHA